MKELKISDITLGDYQKVMIKEEVTDNDMLKCFLKITQKELDKLPQKDVDSYLTQINVLLNTKYELVRTFKLKGTRYGFIPKLDDITYGENLDVTKYIGDYGSMHKAMAVLFRPIKQKIGDRYLLEEYSGSYKFAEQMKQMPLDIVLSAVVFFYNLTNELLSYTLKYLNQEAIKDSGLRTIFQENGVDILNSIHLLKETLHDLRPSLD